MEKVFLSSLYSVIILTEKYIYVFLKQNATKGKAEFISSFNKFLKYFTMFKHK